MCSIEVGREGGTYTVLLEAYQLNCEMGYYRLIVASE